MKLVFCVDRVISGFDRMIKVTYDPDHKLRFCKSFELEIGNNDVTYSEAVYDCIYNIYSFRVCTPPKEFLRKKEAIKSWDFFNPSQVLNSINVIYKEFPLEILQNYMDFFKLSNLDSVSFAQKVLQDKEGYRGLINQYTGTY